VTEDVRLTLAEGVPLVHAMVTRVARDHNIKALLIKGPILEIQGLRTPRQSGDVDVLCEPARLDDLGLALCRLGWERVRNDPLAPQVLEPYAVKYCHGRWPCDIDLHHRFPGFYAPSTAVFTALWSRRDTVELATQPVDCTDLMGSAIVQGLHLLLGRDLVLSESDSEYLVDTLLHRLDGTGRSELAELAATTGAADTLAPILDSIRAPTFGRGQLSQVDQKDWSLRQIASGAKGLMWLEELKSAPPSQWPGIVWRALTFDDRAPYEGRLDQSQSMRSTARIVFRRFRKTIQYLPGALRALLRMGRAR
jgi:hypothetical protein